MIVAAGSRSRAGYLLVWLGIALTLRLVVAGAAGAGSVPAAALFAVLLLVASARAGWRPDRVRPSALAWGVAGAAALVAGPLVSSVGVTRPSPGLPTNAFWLWSVVVTLVALAEEVLVRGALFGSLEERFGLGWALAVTTAVFAVIHVPLYGAGALPLDLAVGLWLGGLRIVSGSVVAPATAHVLADLAGWWLG